MAQGFGKFVSHMMRHNKKEHIQLISIEICSFFENTNMVKENMNKNYYIRAPPMKINP